MGLEITYSVPAIKAKQHTVPEVHLVPPGWVQLYLRIYELAGELRLTNRVVNRVEGPRQIKEYDQELRQEKVVAEVFDFPIHKPRSEPEFWRIGLVVNVIDRKVVADWGSGLPPRSATADHPGMLEDLNGRRLLDSEATWARPFYWDPYDPEQVRTGSRGRGRIRLARPGAGGAPSLENSRGAGGR
jgi:hypothetical protein